MKNRKLWYGLAALAAAWLFDYLFWQKQGGISFVVWIAVLMVFGYLLAWKEGKKASFWSIALSGLILGFALISAWRSEGVTRFCSIVVALAGLLLLVTTFLNGNWIYYRMVDYVTEICKTIGAGFYRGFKLLTFEIDQSNKEASPEQKKPRKAGAIALGIIIALPIVIVFGLLLASADPVFGDMLKRILNIENLPEYIFRFVYIVLGAFILLGLYLHAILPNKNAGKPETNKPWMKPFLGATETGIVLGAINLLFISFVLIQIRYLFGGQANISETGYTYAEYARRGFSELVAIAVLSLGVYLVLRTITKLEKKASRIAFTILAILMMANVLVILASSLQRLLLYESAYGFSELRTYTHVFIFWLAGLIVAAVILELVKKQGFFGLALLVMIVGFTATIGIINVDGVVVNQNIQRAQQGHELDRSYLAELSSDAIPALVNGFMNQSLDESIHTALGVELACRVQNMSEEGKKPWQSLRFGELYNQNLVNKYQTQWSDFVPKKTLSGSGWEIKVGSSTYPCYNYSWMD